MTTLETLKAFTLDRLQCEIEENAAAPSPCPDYAAFLQSELAALANVQTLEQLAAMDWINGRATLALNP